MPDQAQPGIAYKAIQLVGKKIIPARALDRIKRLGMTPRQQHLNHLYIAALGAQYEGRKYDWSGNERHSFLDREAIASKGFLPPGFVDTLGSTLPLQYRKPVAPSGLIAQIINRFSDMLFSENRHPAIRTQGDPDTEDFLGCIAKEGKLWAKMMSARFLGGAMGCVAVGFHFKNGLPRFDVFDPRWCEIDWADPEEFTIRSLDKRVMQKREEWNEGRGVWEDVFYWYRVLIDENRWIVFEEEPVGDGDEPFWRENPEKTVEHGLGFCPVVWIQNLPLEDDMDGLPDCHGIYDHIEARDALISQAHRGTISNCDPTIAITGEEELPANMQKGSGTVVKLPSGEMKYVEMTGSGITAAMDMAKILRAEILEMASCVLESPDNPGGPKTATEIERSYSAMLGKVSKLREQYGQAVDTLLEMILRAVRQLGKPTKGPSGQLVSKVLNLPPRVEVVGGQTKITPRKLGTSEHVELAWPPMVDRDAADELQSIQMTQTAKDAGLVSKRIAIKKIADIFKIDDIEGMLAEIEADAVQAMATQQAQMELQGGVGGETPTEEAPAPTEEQE